MLYGFFPWPATTPAELIYKIENRPLIFPEIPAINSVTQDFIQNALIFDEKMRMDWNRVFTHELFADRK